MEDYKEINSKLIDYSIQKATELHNLSQGLCKGPLDRDMTEALTQIFWLELDYLNGNITDEEYGESMDNMRKELM